MKGKAILLVDDDKRELEVLHRAVKGLGFSSVLAVDSADNAWAVMRSKPVDCVICAYEMGEMSGIALLKILRRENQFFDMPFFLTDGAFTKVKVIKAGQSGVTGLFVSPFDPSVIKEKLTTAMGRPMELVVHKAQKSYDQACELIKKKAYDQALNIFDTLVRQRENPEYYYNIGYIKTAQGKHPEAIEAFYKATQLDRLFAKAYEEMGRVYKLMGDLEKAEKYMQLAAEVYMDTDKIGAAESVLNELLESGMDSLNVFNTLGVLYRKKGDTEESLKQYKKALRVHPDEPYIYYNIGRLYLDMKDMANAREYFQGALKKDSGFEEARQVIKAIDLGMI